MKELVYPQRVITHGLITAALELRHHFKARVTPISEDSHPSNFKWECIFCHSWPLCLKQKTRKASAVFIVLMAQWAHTFPFIINDKSYCGQDQKHQHPWLKFMPFNSTVLFRQSHLLINVRRYQWCLPLHDLSIYRHQHHTGDNIFWNTERQIQLWQTCEGKGNNGSLEPSLQVEIKLLLVHSMCWKGAEPSGSLIAA